ncbi:class I SAM-dependent methyltransferase [Candidatus Ferrigenium straubiae]|uniref:class I SAM-dependent methyltransferase n=1 Tax=Candidatus Ferrigenium straubiae TaxID=2919506 RepID=UPI003F4A8663
MFKKLPPAVAAALLQITAFALTLLGVHLFDLQPSPLALALLCGAYAATLGRLAGLAGWWLPIQFAFAPALVLVLALDIPPDYFLAAFLILLAVYGSTFRTQVPLYLSSDKVWHALESFLPSPASGRGAGGEGNGDGKPNFHFIDLGSGLGGVLTHLARVRPDGRYTGVESAPLPCLASWLRIRLGGHRNCKVHWGSLWNCDLSQYDVVYAYLSPVPMERLWQKARTEMRPGSVFVSSTFAVPEQTPHETVQVDDLHRSTLLVWRM